MNIFLLIRSDIMDIIILLFLIFYGAYCRRGRFVKGNYLLIAGASLGHVVFGMITEITVNSATVSPYVNDICHIFFFIFSVIFGVEYFRYVISMLVSNKRTKTVMIYVYAIAAIGVLILLFSDIIYIQGKGTAYSQGIGPTICYSILFLSVVGSDALLFVRRDRIDDSVIMALLPISVIALAFMFLQVFIPEFLFSENAITFVTIGIFFSVENPVKRVRERSFIDLNTGVYNRNCYEKDCDEYSGMSQDIPMGFVMCDLNYLKMVNDTFGHLEGDKLLERAAMVLQETLTSATKLYRLGGDEFAAIYIGDAVKEMEWETALISGKCEEVSASMQAPLEIAVGYVLREENEPITLMVKRADTAMYENKAELKKANTNKFSRVFDKYEG